MKRGVKKALFDALYILVAVAVIFGAWAVAAAKSESELIVPKIGSVFAEFGIMVRSTAFWQAVGGTMLRCLIGYAVSVALFFVTYSLAVSFDPLARIFSPIISVMRSLPAVAVTLVLVLSVGGSNTPIVLGVLVIFPILYSTAMSRTATVPDELIDICEIGGANKFRRLTAVWLPCLAGGLPESLSSAFSYNVKAVVGAEILAQAASSLGVLMSLSQQEFRQARLVFLVVIAVVLSVAIEAILRVALKLVLRRFRD